jgi:very-short-patch-repair endonuclease
VRRAQLRRVDRGVYAVGHAALRPQGRWLAAVWATGSGAVLSHSSAAQLWTMRCPVLDGLIHVTTTGTAQDRPGVRVHRTKTLTGADRVIEDGVPVTAVPRTILDLAGVLSFAQLRAVSDHGVRLDRGALRRVIERHPHRRGVRNLRRLIGDGELETRSGAERGLRRICRRSGLPLPRCNQRVLGAERDFVWPEHRLVIEVDGGAWHAQRPARERDALRDGDLVAAGWRVVRFSADQVRDEPGMVGARLAVLLGMG